MVEKKGVCCIKSWRPSLRRYFDSSTLSPNSLIISHGQADRRHRSDRYPGTGQSFQPLDDVECGVQGSSVADTFLALPGWRVRGVTRHPAGPAAQAHAENGVEIVKGDLDDQETLVRAFQGATAIFSNTDFFGHLWTGLAAGDKLGGRSPNQYAFDREVEQGLNIAAAAAESSVRRTLDRFVFSSLSDARKWSAGKYTHIYHNEAKAEMIRVIEGRFPEVASRMSLVQVGHYVRNWQVSPPLAPQKQPDGSYRVKRTFSSGYNMPFVVTHQDTGEFVKALVDLPAKTHILGVSQHMTWPAWTELWGRVNGVKATFQQVSDEEYFQGVPPPLKQELAETFAYVEEFGYTGGDPDVKTAEQVSNPVHAQVSCPVSLSLTSAARTLHPRHVHGRVLPRRGLVDGSVRERGFAGCKGVGKSGHHQAPSKMMWNLGEDRFSVARRCTGSERGEK
jgi:hypothetical protein